MTELPISEDQEYKRLQAEVAQIENSLARAAASGSTVASALATYLNSLKTRLFTLDEKHKALEQEKQRSTDQQNIAALVERESALSEREREQFGGFLEKEFFTKADFGDLEGFYCSTWDRLSEGGKAEMSQRIWEGVRHGGYAFCELPEIVKEKEAQRLRDALVAGDRQEGELAQIPAQNRADFVQAWDSGNRQEAYKVLERPSFAEHVARSPEITPSKNAVGEGVADTQEVKTEETKIEKTKGTETTRSAGTLDFKDVDPEAHNLSAPLKGKLPTGSAVRGS